MSSASPTTRMPVAFLGHGSPMLMISPNRFTGLWDRIGESLPRPNAILSVSAHWVTDGTAVTTAKAPVTIHDFYGFPAELYKMHYDAPGSAALAERVTELLHPVSVIQDSEWGFDHGTWSVLSHLYPAADIPVIQLSLNGRLDGAGHLALARKLRPLRDEGILVLGSGNVVHNLRRAVPNGEVAPYPWAARFEEAVEEALLSHDHDALAGELMRSEDGHMSAPSPEHYWPLLYCVALCDASDEVTFPIEGIEAASISMLAAIFKPSLTA